MYFLSDIAFYPFLSLSFYSSLALLIILLFLIKIGRDTLYFTYYWQLKEYRLDRFRDHLSTKKGRRQILTYSLLFHFILVLLAFIHFIDERFDQLFIYLVTIFLVVEFVKIVLEVFKRRLKRPDFTFKAFLIILGTLFFETVIIVWFSHYEFIYWFNNYSSVYGISVIFLFFSLPLPIIVTLAVIALKPVTYLMKKRIINKAKAKIASMPDLKVIGITGSYGKTSTKEFLYTILSQKYKTAKTGEHINVDIGVAMEVLNKLKNDTEIFIVEMGAYKIGEIKASCDIVKPQIGIITGINQQHLSLFGSQENIIKAKSELVEALPVSGTAILNFDNNYLAELKLKVKTLFYSLKEEKNCYASEIKVLTDKLEFRVYLGKEAEDFTINIQGKHNISNLLACIVAANEVGMSLSDIKNACKKIKPLPKTLKTFKGVNESVLIDDSYNANPDGVIEALKFMNIYKDYKKIFVFPGMLELGKATAEAHIKVSKKAKEICDYIFITSPDFINPLKEGLKDFPEENLFIESDQEKILEKIKKLLEKEKSVVLFESRGAEKVLNNLKNEKTSKKD